ncbi:MAG: hypothetical protein JWO25_3347 [Alphaproteobacteria bacterium]|nr:hypothetical protein [Alphaproteobacteria bacterium]
MRNLRMDTVMRISPFYLAACCAILAVSIPAESQPAVSASTYADLADLALAAPVTAQVRLTSSVEVKKEQAATVPPGYARFYVEADIVALIHSSESLPSHVDYLVDLPRDSRGKAPKLRKGNEYLLFAAPVRGRPDSLQLVARDAQLPWSPGQAAQVRAILTESTGREPPPRITGIGRAFHVPGSIPGEGETQIFLQTAERRPVSLSVLRRPGEQPRWAVALSEIVDESAAPPNPGSLLWYRLACSLPPTLPAQSLADSDSENAAAAAADYRFVLEQLGACARTRSRQ